MIINGTPNDETLFGTPDADIIHGLGGNDTIFGGDGDDQLFGDDGNDIITLGGNGMRVGRFVPVFTATIAGDGGSGNDTLIVDTNASNVTALGGDGDDIIRLQGIGGVAVNGGAGRDVIDIRLIGTGVFTLGLGADTVILQSDAYLAPGYSITITDYVQGEDRLSLNLFGLLSGWNTATNPFTGGYLRLTQSGADTLLEYDRDGSAGSAFGFASLFRLQNIVATTVTDIDLYPTDGSGRILNGTVAAETINGTSISDTINGLAGNDAIYGGGGGDTIHGNDGDDFIDGQGGSARLFGDADNDTLVVGLVGSYRAADALILDGGDGDDYLFFGNSVVSSIDIANGLPRSASVTVRGGAGSDAILLWGSGAAMVDAGAGADFVDVGGVNQSFAQGVVPAIYTITLGGGSDTISLISSTSSAVHVVTDFNPLEDRIALSEAGLFRGNQPIQVFDAFGEGFLRLVASGADTILQLDRTGGGDQWVDLTRFLNIAPGAITEVGGFRVSGGTVDLTIAATGGYVFNTGLTPVQTTVRGGGGNDTITGTEGSDSLAGEGGNDTLRGLGGNDRIETGFGDNLVEGGVGDDRILGQGAHDRLYGGDGNDQITYTPLVPYGATTDTVLLDGGAGDDILRVSSNFASSIFVGGDGNDDITIDGFGNSVVDAGNGNDRITMSNGFSTLTLGAGADTVTARLFFTTPEEQMLIISDFQPGIDRLVFNRADYLRAFSTGNPFAQGDLWLLQDGADVILRRDADGGGNTYYDFVRFQNTTRDSFTAGDFGGSDPHVAPLIAPLQGTAVSDTLFGSSLANVILGLGGDDLISGGGGGDSLYGGTGNDTYGAVRQDDVIFENADEGTDSVFSTANFYLYANIENLTLLDGAGNIFGVGNALANTIIGNDGANTLLGGGGDDVVSGGGGVDILYGEGGNDRLVGDAGNDFLAGGSGDDVLNGGTGGDSLYGEDGDDTLIGGSDFVFDQLVGGAGNDLLRGDSGLGDYDYLYGNSGNDEYYVDTPSDLIFEQVGEGIDTVYAVIAGAGYYLYDNIENLVLLGNTPFGVGNGLANRLTGNAISNFLLGGGGNDTLNGGGGNDVLFGEDGADTFVFERGTGGDVIGDFVAGTDRADLSALGFTSFAQVQAALGQNGSNSFINFGNGDFVVINGVAMSSLQAGDFVFADSASANSQRLAASATAQSYGTAIQSIADTEFQSMRFEHAMTHGYGIATIATDFGFAQL